jgi:hypothetical protein
MLKNVSFRHTVFLADLELIVEHVLGTSIVVQLLRPLVSSITALRYSPSPPPSTVTVVTTVATEAGEYGVLQPEAQSDSMMIALQCVPALQSVISDLDRFLASVYDKLLRSNLLKVPRKVNRTPTAVAASEIPFNRAGFPMRLGVTNVYYCSRRLGTSAIPRSDGQCGPNNGPQCDDCKAGVDSYSAPLNRAGVKMSPGTAPQLYCGRTIGVSALNGAKLVCGPLDGPQCDDCRAGPVVQPEIESGTSV